MRNGGYYVISGYSKNLYGNSRVGIMSGLSLYPKKRKHEICTFSYRQSFHVGNAEYLSDFDRQRNWERLIAVHVHLFLLSLQLRCSGRWYLLYRHGGIRASGLKF